MAARVPFDSLTLRAVAEQLRRALVGGVVQHVAQPAGTDVVLTVRSRGASHALLLSCDASFARAHLTFIKRPNPQTPPAFCMLCRKYLEGARVRGVEQRGFDRILDVTFETGAGVLYRLVAELMGKHSNIVLLDEGDVILDAAKRISHRLSRHRETLPGRTYVAPPAQAEKADPFVATPDEVAALETGSRDPEAFASRLMGQYAGLSPFLASELVARAQDGPLAEAWDELFGAASRGEWSPVVVRDERARPVGAYPFPTVQYPSGDQHERADISTALDHYFGVALPRAALDAAVGDLRGRIDQALKSRERQRASAERSLAEAARADVYRTSGELILANLHMVEPDAESVTVTDYYAPDAPARAIQLDPALSPRENADAYFRRYRKARDGAARQQEHLDRVETDVRTLRAARDRLADVKDVAGAQTLRDELTKAGLLRPEGEAGGADAARRPDFDGRKIRVYNAPEGFEIYVGENAEANDYLTGKVAAPNDLWLHVRANTSAHVVIRTRNAPASVPRAVLERAAAIAAQHSPAKHSSLVPVDYTLKKYVRRPRGAATGFAVYQNEKTLYVTPKDS